MSVLAQIAFTTPWLLIGLLLLPVLWFLLRAAPPAPVRRRFPAVALLLGLKDDETTPDRTPWWLLLLRMLAIASLIVGFAGPVLNPEKQATITDDPLLVLMDASWASAPTWSARVAYAETLIARAGRDGHPVALVLATASSSGELQFTGAEVAGSRLSGLNPVAWAPDYGELNSVVRAEGQGFETLWISDGLEHPGRSDLADLLKEKGSVTVVQSDRPALGLLAPVIERDQLVVPVVRSLDVGAQKIAIHAIGPDPSGVERILAQQEMAFRNRRDGTLINF